MRIYAGMVPTHPLTDVGSAARRAERLGFDGLRIPETIHDSMMVAALAAEHTATMEIGTGVTIAFPRSPMVTALAAWDLQQFSGGRFCLGLGSQVRGSMTGRFATSWAEPIARMRDYVGALRAIWRAFSDGGRLDYHSDNYVLTRLQPIFRPEPLAEPGIRLALGAVNAGMSCLAGEVADEVLVHPTANDPALLAATTLPAIRRGIERSGRAREDVDILVMVQLVTGRSEGDVERAREKQRGQLSVLMSTPNYRYSLTSPDEIEVSERLHALSRAGRWEQMPALVTDGLLDRLVPSGTYDQIADVLLDRYKELAAGIVLIPQAGEDDDDVIAQIVSRLRTR